MSARAGIIAALTLAGAARAEIPDADRLAANQDGGARFEQRCAVCHAAGGMGANVLAARLGPGRSLLAERTDLTAPYVLYVVRNGLNAMPRLSRVEVTDPELKAIAAYLTRSRK